MSTTSNEMLIQALTARGLLSADAPAFEQRTVDRPWYIGVVLGLAGWLAGLFTMIFVAMLFEPNTTRANFWAAKFISLVLFEQLKSPNAPGPCSSTTAFSPDAARSSASSQLAVRSGPPRRSRTIGSVSRTSLGICL